MQLLILIAIALFLLSIVAYPAGVLPIYTETSDTISVSVPKNLRDMGYPAKIFVDRRYIEIRFKGNYDYFLNVTFTNDGIYDAENKRIISPSEAENYVLGSRVEVNWVKVGLLVTGMLFLVAGLSSSSEMSNSRRPVGGYVP
ncbi:MAG: hypothetical protein QXQ33_00570 [Nitrososphaerota archaeon]